MPRLLALAERWRQNCKEIKSVKITKSQLKQIIKEELDNALEEGSWAGTENFPIQEPTKGEGSMAQGQLHRIGELADMISQQFGDSTNLEEWVEAKITKAQDYLSSVMNYMRGQADEKAAEEILSTRMGSYAGTTLPGGKKVPEIGGTRSQEKPRLEPWME